MAWVGMEHAFSWSGLGMGFMAWVGYVFFHIFFGSLYFVLRFLLGAIRAYTSFV